MRDALASDGLTPAPRRRQKPRLDVRAPELSLFDFPLRKAAEAHRDAEFVAPVLETPTREIQGMVRGEASIESQAAAVAALRTRKWVQDAIVAIITKLGPMTARELEHHPTFYEKTGRSTVSARLSDLKASGAIVQVGRRDKQGVWGISTSDVDKSVDGS